MPKLDIARRAGFGVLVAALAGCADRTPPCTRCDTVVIAAVGEPASLLPPLVVETVGRDISDQVFERLADLKPGGAPVDPAAFRPRLAARWERVDSLRWRFHLRPGARWHDGRPVTAEDVRFSFDAFSDSLLDSPARPTLAGRVRAEVEDSATVVVAFDRPSPEQLYDATYHVRVIPAHLWDSVPRADWRARTGPGRLIGSGPYRVREWVPGQHVALIADSAGAATAGAGAGIGRAVWRFTTDPDAALNLLLAHEADLLETVGAPERAARIATDSAFRLQRYPSAAYGFLGFRLAAPAGSRPHAVLGDVRVRRALTLALNRPALARSIFGEDTRVPPGPMSRLLWIWDDGIRALPYDSAAAARLLDEAGWRRGPDGVRRRAGRELAVEILVPTTSPSRRLLAQAVDAMWRGAGVASTITAVDFPIFQERLGAGRFDSYIGAWLDEPSARGLADQWTRAGWPALNFGRYASPTFDSLLAAAGRIEGAEPARRAYREAMDTLNADAPAIFLYAPANAAVVSRRLQGVEIDPYSWISGLPSWRIAGEAR